MDTSFEPAVFNFTIGNGFGIFKGSTWYVPITCMGDGKPVDLTGFTGRCQIKANAQSRDAVATPKVVIEDAPLGIFSLNLTDEETLSIPAEGLTYSDMEVYQYDLYFDDIDGDAYRAMQGLVEVSPNVSGV